LFTASAATLSLTPPAQTVPVGSSATVTLSISGLDPRNGSSLGAWAGTIVFDSSILSLQSAQIQYGTGLDLGIAGSLQSTDDSAAAIGSISLQEISFESISDLESSQSSSFPLAVFTFVSLGGGSSDISFTNVDLSDASGNSFATPDPSIASITVQSASSVPENLHWTAAAISMGCVLVLGRRRNVVS
jgi:hypothetical protein